MASFRADRLCVLLLAAVMAMPLAHAQPAPMTPEARAHFERGRSYFDARDYQAAIDEFRAGYRIQPHADFLYSLAQAERLRGDCRAAIDAYRAFLASGPPESEAELAKGHVARCEAALAPKPRPKPKPKPRAEPEPNVVPEDAWYEDPLGHVLCAVGLGALGVGVGLLAVGEAKARETHDPAGYEAFGEAQRDAKTLRIAAPITLAIGGALFVGGVVRFATFSLGSGSAAFVSVTRAF